MRTVEPINFLNSQGHRLAGTLHRPDSTAVERPAVILLSPGVKMRVGPGRLYVALTELLTELGHTVLRFDFYGLGDSEGELQEPLLSEIYNHVEVGRYVDDTLCALRWMRETYGHTSFILGGLCGGATTAALAAERDASVQYLLCIGLAITLSSDAATPAKYLTRVELDHRRSGYIRRLMQPRSWLRLLTLQSEYGVIWRSMKRLIVKDKPTPAPGPPDTSAHIGDASPLFPPAYFSFLERGGKVLLVFSEKDRLPSEYDEKFALPYSGRLLRFQAQIRHHIVLGANHVLSLPEWRKELLSVTQAWIESDVRTM